MSTRKPPNTRIYVPEVGETVKDIATGKTGVLTGTHNREAYLRPSGGGIEFSTMPWNIEPVEGVDQLEFVQHPPPPPEEDVAEPPAPPTAA
ncbi:hypothetical protein [Kitasatospora sp. NPDC087315]|uniref:hypothetical protein n=1 Tax=Kitasatospora sp. NPDC087315 TaxID=3364069 RepID=UPI0037F6AF7B